MLASSIQCSVISFGSPQQQSVGSVGKQRQRAAAAAVIRFSGGGVNHTRYRINGNAWRDDPAIRWFIALHPPKTQLKPDSTRTTFLMNQGFPGLFGAVIPNCVGQTSYRTQFPKPPSLKP